MTTHEAEDLRRDLRRHGRARGKRFDPELRQRVVAFAEKRRSEGASWMMIATELGACFETVRRWCGGGRLTGPSSTRARESASSRVTRQLRRVEVIAEPIIPVPPRAPLAMVTPNGHRIEGVGIDEIVALVRALG